MLSLFVPPPSLDVSLCPGTNVVVDGLIKAPHFNGCIGVVQSFDPEVDRYDVSLVSLQQTAKVKREHLRVVAVSSCLMPEGEEDEEPEVSSEEVWEEGHVLRRRRRRRRRGKRGKKGAAAAAPALTVQELGGLFNGDVDRATLSVLGLLADTPAC